MEPRSAGPWCFPQEVYGIEYVHMVHRVPVALLLGPGYIDSVV